MIEKRRKQKMSKIDKKNETNETCPLCLKMEVLNESKENLREKERRI